MEKEVGVDVGCRWGMMLRGYLERCEASSLSVGCLWWWRICSGGLWFGWLDQMIEIEDTLGGSGLWVEGTCWESGLLLAIF